MTNFQGAVQGFVYSTVSFIFPEFAGKLKETVEYTIPCIVSWWYRKFVISSSDIKQIPKLKNVYSLACIVKGPEQWSTIKKEKHT